ncbi:MAG TPA: MFS transporter [Stellaceae bacterium]|nr:MFS transporter [Stellaceae bacterium]
MTITALTPASRSAGAERGRWRVAAVACGAHALHDGLTDTLYLLLPIFQTEFALSYAAVGMLRALYAGAMAGAQLPAARLAQRLSRAGLLAAGTALAGAAYLCLSETSSIAVLAAALLVGGIGSSTQHPIGSSLVAAAYEGPASRGALGTYNFAGDLGKMALPSLAAGLIALVAWRWAASLLGVIAIVGAAAILLLSRQLHGRRGEPARIAPAAGTPPRAAAAARDGFAVLLAIGIIDSATRMGFLTFLPFLLRAKGAALPEIGIALTLLFAGGAAGKLVCGFLGARCGMLPTVLVTEGATAAAILALLPLSLAATLALLPLIGIVLNGTSSVLCGTVPELVTAERRERAFGVFYTGTIGAGAVSPVLCGLFSDAVSLPAAMLLVASAVLLTLPLAWRLSRIIGPTA